jgi:hypothetical protein
VPLTLTPHQRLHLQNRIMLQSPKEASPAEIAAHQRGLERSLNGIPGDVLFALDALRLLADQGNVVARDLFQMEIERMGLTQVRYYGIGE